MNYTNVYTTKTLRTRLHCLLVAAIKYMYKKKKLTPMNKPRLIVSNGPKINRAPKSSVLIKYIMSF